MLLHITRSKLVLYGHRFQFHCIWTGHLKTNNLMINNFFSCVHVCMYLCGGQRSISGGPLLFSISFVRTGSLRKCRAHQLARLTSQKPPGNLLYPLSTKMLNCVCEYWVSELSASLLWCLAVYMSTGCLNSVPHAYQLSTSPPYL